MPKGPEEDRDLQVGAINRLRYKMENNIIDDQCTKRRTAVTKGSLENIVSYNHCLSFISE